MRIKCKFGKITFMKTAIILSGGGMMASYCVGALLKLKEDGINPDIIIAGSGSAGTASYFVANQPESITKIWVDLLPTKKFINLFRIHKILNIDYLIDHVFKIQEPLADMRIPQSTIHYLIPVTDYKNGEVDYLSNKSESFDVFESMRATMAFPILYKKKVVIGSKEYSDGLFAASPYFHIRKAKELGAERIYVVDCGIRTNKILYRIFLLFKSREFRKLHLKYLKIKYDISDGVTVIKPRRLAGGILDNRKRVLENLIEEGRKL